VRRIVGMEVVSGLGDGVFWVGLIAILVGDDVGARGFAVAALVRLGPRAVMSAPAGVLTDRVDRRRLLVGLDFCRAALMVGLAIAAAASAEIGVLLMIVLAAYTLAAPYRPALTAALPAIAGESSLSTANALIGTVRQVMTFVGPVVGAIVVHWWSPAVAFAVNAMSFACAGLLVLGVSELSGSRATTATDVVARRARWRITGGLGEVRRVRGIHVLVVLVFVMYVARGAELVLYALVAVQRLGLGSTGIGVLTGAVGLGAVLALPVAARVAEADRSDVMVTVSVLATAVPIALLGVTRSPVVACVGLLVVGASVVVFEVVSVILLQRLAQREMLGRVFGVVGAASNAGKLVGAVAAPAIVFALNVSQALIITGVVVAVAGVASVPSLVALCRTTRLRRELLRPHIDVLATLGVFEGASPLALERIAGTMTTEHLSAGSVVVRQGDRADDLFVIREGDFDVMDGDRRINTMQRGDWFGEIGLLRRTPRTATVVARTDAIVWRIPGETFLDALADLASEPTGLLNVMADRLSRSAMIGQNDSGDRGAHVIP
jgi:CRP-like cAMP-binding protein/predicted MFS family arabinose efflux permease